MLSLAFQHGIHLPAQDLWLDPRGSKPLAFVSHAHSDHTGKHGETILSHPTSVLMRERIGKSRAEHVLDFHAPTMIRDFQVTLLPAGHIFGSAQSFIETETGSLLYTGDFKLRASPAAEPTSWCHAETLIMETTFGLPKYRFPPNEEVLRQMVAFCHETLADGAVPVLLGYSLGKAQEILCALCAAGLVPMVHGAVQKMTAIYQQLWPDFPASFLPFDANEVAGKVLVVPPNVMRSPMMTAIKRRRVAALTGWAIDPHARYRLQCDVALPLSDHADYDDLLRYVELVQPQRVLTLHGFAAEFARDLRARGVEAWSLTSNDQLDLAFDGTQFRP